MFASWAVDSESFMQESGPFCRQVGWVESCCRWQGRPAVPSVLGGAWKEMIGQGNSGIFADVVLA